MFVKMTGAQVGSEGDPDSPLAIIGEAPGADEERAGRPFVGAAGRVLESCLHQAGLIRSRVYLTNVVKVRPPKNDVSPYYHKKKGRFTKDGWQYVEALRDELSKTTCKVMIPVGNTALTALTSASFEQQGLNRVNTYRGYLMESELLPGRMLLPAIHPASCLHGSYIDRYYIAMDFKKAAGIAETGQPHDRCEFIIPETVADVQAGLAHCVQNLDKAHGLSFDIEVIQFEVSCIGFSVSPYWGLSIPIHGAWSETEEVQVWQSIAEVLENPTIPKIGQNLPFDISFLAIRNKIVVRGVIKDTMLLHRIMYPDFASGLNFLGATYTNRAYWKGMVNFKNIKKES